MDLPVAPPVASAPPTALCPAHPDRPASTVCARCGAFVCVHCEVRLAKTCLCQACDARLGTGPSALAVSAALLSMVGPCMAFVPGFVGLALAYLERSRIARGSAPSAGAGWVNAARILGWVNLALAALTFLVLKIRSP